MNDIIEMNMLAVDTSSSSLHLAVAFGGDRLVKSSEDVGLSHGRVIVKKINDLLTSASLQKQMLHALVVGVGPGSFTGLRISLAVIKGIAVALEIPIVSASILELVTLVQQESKGPVMIIAPFKKDACFIGVLQDGRFSNETLMTVEYIHLAETVHNRPIIIAGDLGKHGQIASESASLTTIYEFDPAHMIDLGRQKLSRQEVSDLATLEPLYLRKSQAEIRFDQRNDNHPK